MILLDDIKSQRIPASAVAAKKLLLTGPVGVGKTTAAKALAARAMGVEPLIRQYMTAQEALPGTRRTDEPDMSDLSRVFPFDFFHVNGGDDGIDKIRDLAAASMQSPTDPQCRCRAFVIDEVHALPDKAVQALLLPLERDTVNIWIACTSRPAGALDKALRSRFSYHLDFGAADVAAVMRQQGVDEATASRLAKESQGDLRLALGGGVTRAEDIAEELMKMPRAWPASGPGPHPILAVDAKRLISLALRNPFAVQTRILDALVDYPEQHTIMCCMLSIRNDVAAHQLLAAARKARLL